MERREVMSQLAGIYVPLPTLFVDPNLDVREGYINFPTLPGVGTRLRPEVLQRADASIQVSE